MELVFDFGNSWGKWYIPPTQRGGGQKGDFIHAIAPLKENDWNKIVGRGTPPDGYIRVNGQGYAIGNAARRHTLAEKPRGAARYKDSYYGAALAYALTQAYGKSQRSIELFASHAPQDIIYAKHIIAESKGVWTIECNAGTLTYNVSHVSTFDEPIGGFCHFVFTQEGKERKNNPFGAKTILVLDVGGHTSDVVAVDPGGQLDLMSLNSTRTGVIDMTKRFEKALRDNNRHIFQDAGDLDIRRVESAIRSGMFEFGREKIDCSAESYEAMNELVYDLIQIINAAGGVVNYDYLLMTGGGGALVFDALQTALPRIELVLAEKNRDDMKFANVFGGAKLLRLLEQM